MKLFYGVTIFCVVYFTIAGIMAYKLSKNAKGKGVLHHDCVSEVIKENGIWDIYNINGRDLK